MWCVLRFLSSVPKTNRVGLYEAVFLSFNHVNKGTNFFAAKLNTYESAKRIRGCYSVFEILYIRSHKSTARKLSFKRLLSPPKVLTPVITLVIRPSRP